MRVPSRARRAVVVQRDPPVKCVRKTGAAMHSIADRGRRLSVGYDSATEMRWSVPPSKTSVPARPIDVLVNQRPASAALSTTCGTPTPDSSEWQPVEVPMCAGLFLMLASRAAWNGRAPERPDYQYRASHAESFGAHRSA
jgi:hypothetical protein